MYILKTYLLYSQRDQSEARNSSAHSARVSTLRSSQHVPQMRGAEVAECSGRRQAQALSPSGLAWEGPAAGWRV